ncbi:MAG: hypothetical protein WC758_08445 [Candidatus Woesearchaeota archaeon]|jgi:uncharacterized damage-inducible protein DinB
MTFKKGDKVNLGKKRPRNGRKKNQLVHTAILRDTNERLKEYKELFRKANKKQFNNMDDVLKHILDKFNLWVKYHNQLNLK